MEENYLIKGKIVLTLFSPVYGPPMISYFPPQILARFQKMNALFVQCRYPLFSVLVFSHFATGVCSASEQDQKIKSGYATLVETFAEDRPGYGLDHFQKYVGDQPMTVGLYLSSEAMHQRSEPNEESLRRVRKATKWLLDNSDLDEDNAPGWGLPQPWDAGGDGTENAANQPYTITTAIVLAGLLDALNLDDTWSKEEETEILSLVVEVVKRWCNEVWSEGFQGGYFWYSPNKVDDNFGINASSMFLASLCRLLDEHKGALSEKDTRLFRGRADQLATALVSTVELREGVPFWKYIAVPNRYNRKSPNDLVHHVYTLWGIETYRDTGGSVELSWTREQAIESVDRFWRKDAPGEAPARFPQDSDWKLDYEPRLWGVGIMLGFYGKWDTPEKANACFQSVYPFTKITENGPN